MRRGMQEGEEEAVPHGDPEAEARGRPQNMAWGPVNPATPRNSGQTCPSPTAVTDSPQGPECWSWCRIFPSVSRLRGMPAHCRRHPDAPGEQTPPGLIIHPATQGLK